MKIEIEKSNALKAFKEAGSKTLIETIQQVPKKDFPFSTTIVKEDERFEFT